MAFIREISPEEAPDAVRELYEADRRALGYVANYTKVLGQRPDAHAAWVSLVGAVRRRLDVRRYELVTLAAAARLRSSYCALAHGAVLLRNGIFSGDELRAIARDFRTAGLPPAEVAMMEFVQKVAGEAHAVTAADHEALRRHGFSDDEILDIALAAAARCFFSTLLSATGAEPDAAFGRLDPAVREALEIERPHGAAREPSGA
jgi:uncharacterized peroxidase-related enzyme